MASTSSTPEKKGCRVFVLSKKKLKSYDMYDIVYKEDDEGSRSPEPQPLQLYVAHDKHVSFEEELYYKLTKTTKNGTNLNLNGDSRHYEISDYKGFDLKEIKNKFYNSPAISITDAKKLPKKRRLSVTGTIDKVSSRREDKYSRQDITLTENATSITLKLWNEKATLSDLNVHDRVTVTNVETTEYQGTIELQSTGQTAVVIDTEIREKTISVLGVNVGKTAVAVIDDDGDEYLVDEGISPEVFLQSRDSEIKVRLQGQRIVSVVTDM